MKYHTLAIKRSPMSKGIIRRLSAVTRNRKQRVAAASGAMEAEDDDLTSKISRVLIILFLLHIVAIGLIFVHQRFLAGRTTANPAASKTGTAEVVSSSGTDAPRLAPGEKPYVVRAGDNYARIATAEGVDEPSLRLINKNVDIGPNQTLKIPAKRTVAADPPEVTSVREQTSNDHDRNFMPVEVATPNVSGAPKAHAVRQGATRESPPASATAGKTATATGKSKGKPYVVQAGDSISRIAKRAKVSESALMRANGITDPRKMQTGMKLTIPQS